MSIWQTKEWQEMLKISGQTEKTFNIKGLFVEKRTIAFGKYGMFIIGCNFSDITLDIEDELKKLTKRENALFLQIENIEYFSKNINFQSLMFSQGSYKKFIMPYTAVIDLEQQEDIILSNMKQKGRYNIKLAEKKGIEIKEVEKNKENIKIFFDLMKETTNRDGFSGNSILYYEMFLKNIKESKLLFAYYDGKVLSSGIFVYYGNIAIYYYGASTSNPNYRNLMSPYLLQWEAIKIGKRLGCTLYDFLGIASPGDNNSALIGVTDFKKKLTNDIRNVSKSYIFINKKVQYYIINFLKKLKRN